MKKKQVQLNRHQLDRGIERYHDNMRIYIRMKDELNSLTVSASTTKYGIETTMPKAAGSISDPVYTHIQMRASRVVRISKIKDELVMVQNLCRKVTGDIEQEVLFWLLEGKSSRWIGERLGVSHTTVQRVRERILDMMLK